jgi:hypothetical protein
MGKMWHVNDAELNQQPYEAIRSKGVETLGPNGRV